MIIFFALVGLIGLWEFYRLAGRMGKASFRPIGFLLHLLCISSIFFLPDVGSGKPVMIPIILAGQMYMLVELFKTKSSVYSFPPLLLAFLYITIPCLLLMRLALGDYVSNFVHATYNPSKVLGIIFFIWINDTGAYLVGSFIGKHKMYERISPGKTWEGTVGGIVLAFAFSFIMVRIFPQLELKHWMVIAVLVGIFGTLGDLVESMLKRLAGVKDSGNIMPGHGGVLDRFDSLFFVTPFVYCYLLLAGQS
jgi:phosphatidate cytidylyltransferase